MVITTLGAASGMAMGGMRMSTLNTGASSSNVGTRVSSRQSKGGSSHRTALSSMAPGTMPRPRQWNKEEQRTPKRLSSAVENQNQVGSVLDLVTEGAPSQDSSDDLPEEFYLLLDPSQPVQLSLLQLSSPVDNWKLDRLVASLGRNRVTWLRALVLFDWLKDSGHSCDDRLCTSVIRVCADHGDAVSALNVYEWMRSPEWAGGGGLHPTNYTYTAAMRAAMSANLLPRAMQIWEESVSDGVYPDCRFCLTYIEVCTRLGQTEKAMRMYADMRDSPAGSPMKPSVHVYTAAMRAATDGNQWLRAFDVWRDMETAGCEPTGHAYAAVISACAAGSDWVRALALFEQMSSRGIRPDVVSCTALITALASAGEAQKATDVVEWMLKNNLKPNVRTYTALIRALCNAKEWTQAMEMLHLMQRPELGSVQPNAFTYSAVLSSLGEQGQWQLAEAVFIHLEKQSGSGSSLPYSYRDRDRQRVFLDPQAMGVDRGVNRVPISVVKTIGGNNVPAPPRTPPVSADQQAPTLTQPGPSPDQRASPLNPQPGLPSIISSSPTPQTPDSSQVKGVGQEETSVWSSASQLNGISLLEVNNVSSGQQAARAAGPLTSEPSRPATAAHAAAMYRQSPAVDSNKGGPGSSAGAGGSESFSLFSRQPNGWRTPSRSSPPSPESAGTDNQPGQANFARRFPLDTTSEASSPLLFQSLSIQASTTIADQLSAMSAIAALSSLKPPPNPETWPTLVRERGSQGAPAPRGGKGPHVGEKLINEVVCNAMMSAYERAGKCEEAVGVLERARALGLRPNHIMYNTAISAAGKAGQLSTVEQLFEQIYEPDTISYETLIAAYGMAGQPDKAEAALKVMVTDRGLTPRDYAYCGLVAAHSLAGDTKSALAIRQRMQRDNVPLTVQVYNALLAACERGGLYEKALDLHRAMQREGLEPNVVTQQLMTVVGRRGVANVEGQQVATAAISAAFAAAGSILIQRGLF